jgi:hypothetical protein
MGFQFVEMTSWDNKNSLGVVYNAELFLFEEEFMLAGDLHKFEDLRTSAKDSEDTIRELRVIPTYLPMPSTDLIKESEASFETFPNGAADAPVETMRTIAVFKRFSAYQNDRRITGDRALLPGTYGTTEEDARYVKTGKEAVARYALPNPMPAVYIFSIKPAGNTRLQKGIVQPKFGQPGGGVEVLFLEGTTSHTVTGPSVIPKA